MLSRTILTAGGGAVQRVRYPPLAPTDGNCRLLSMYAQASRELSVGSVSAVDPGRTGAADISFTAGHVSMALDGLGLMDHGDHTAGETADLTTRRARPSEPRCSCTACGSGRRIDDSGW